MIAFLLKYSALNTEGSYLVYANNESEAIEKLKKHLFFLTQLHITNTTIL